MHADHSPNISCALTIKPSRRSLLLSLLAFSAVGMRLGDNIVDAKEAKRPPKPDNMLTPDAALRRLVEGNDRFVQGTSLGGDFKRERQALVDGQNPYAAVLSCADSRIAPELAFDSGLGDLFVCRLAGNFANDDTLASMEYAVAVLNTPLILVLGHDRCGAIDATIKSLNDEKPAPGHIPSLVAALAPAVRESHQQTGDAFANAIRQNVVDNVDKLKSAGPVLNAAVEQNRLKVIGGLYRLDTGKVDLLN
ncbi:MULTISPECIES: carbonic anhydrase [Bradyrhizobium]|uniref:carbonic anhydrase n=1 Tax=Bradyrhizobium TaxID=374 RepID=UPI0008415D99|nr:MULTISPECIES: carbonic anhydrase [Bradyrhizobium]MCP1838194.1 carbonic anhydrase [Bradyrhizobium sp. USDA 4538]MCP1898757.1 carbonic anhydrase [Bradyrhizobium sp. USDA 4537]MCP1909255.1 carbonic anhydrase [Bradyrhizobium elkanii]MCP1987131.1 carbonic anhydrase [Bradyrhizobium sp. USDA 4539]ODM76411.1 carbonic anhydrase [Bradyrhizobium elkanii]